MIRAFQKIAGPALKPGEMPRVDFNKGPNLQSSWKSMGVTPPSPAANRADQARISQNAQAGNAKLMAAMRPPQGNPMQGGAPKALAGGSPSAPPTQASATAKPMAAPAATVKPMNAPAAPAKPIAAKPMMAPQAPVTSAIKNVAMK